MSDYIDELVDEYEQGATIFVRRDLRALAARIRAEASGSGEVAALRKALELVRNLVPPDALGGQQLSIIDAALKGDA